MSDIWKRIGELIGPRRTGTNELLKHEWTGLQSLWRVCSTSAHAADKDEAEAIDSLLAGEPPASDAVGWARLNEAEGRVGAFLTPVQLPIEFATLLQIATARSLPTLTAHKGNSVLFGNPGDPPDPAKLGAQRAAYASLLFDLQSDFINTRFRRALRNEVAARLFRYGVMAVLLAAIVPLILVWNQRGLIATDPKHPLSPTQAMRFFSDEPIYGLVMVATFGILGAYFSRAIAFQGSLATITFDEVMTSYVGRVLRMRLLYGMIGAIIFYFILRGNLVGGSIFPDLKAIGIGEQIVWQATDQGIVPGPASGKLVPAGLTILAPTIDMAKLLVWSFLAGFSERLVPDTLAKTEAKSTASS